MQPNPGKATEERPLQTPQPDPLVRDRLVLGPLPEVPSDGAACVQLGHPTAGTVGLHLSLVEAPVSLLSRALLVSGIQQGH